MGTIHSITGGRKALSQSEIDQLNTPPLTQRQRNILNLVNYILASTNTERVPMDIRPNHPWLHIRNISIGELEQTLPPDIQKQVDLEKLLNHLHDIMNRIVPIDSHHG